MWKSLVPLIGLLACTGTWNAEQGRAQENGSDASLSGSNVELPYVQSISAVGMRNFERGRWGTMKAVIFNPTTTDRDIKISAFVEEYEHQQFGCVTRVPARSRVVATFPFFVPPAPQEMVRPEDQVAGVAAGDPNNGNADQLPEFQRAKLDYENLLAWASDVTGGGNVPIPARENEPQFNVPINFGHPEPKMGVIGRVLPGRETDNSASIEIEAIKASRTTYRRTMRTFSFLPYELPVDAQGLEVFQQIVVMGPGLIADSRSTEALRAWVQRGGRLWIMLDHVDPQWLAQLLEDTANFDWVSETTLEQVRWHYELPGEVADEVRDYEDPIPFHRLVTSGVTTQWSIDGWPAVMSLEMGQGSILFTAIGARALVFPANQSDFGIPPALVEGGTSSLTDYSSNYKLEEFLEKTAFAQMVADAKPLVQQPEAAAQYVRAHLAYEVPKRWKVVALLLLFCASVAVAGIVLGKSDRLRMMIFVLPGLSLVGMAIFGWLGASSRQSAQEVVAELQLVQGRNGLSAIDLESRGLAFVTNTTARSIDSDHAGTTRFLREPADVRLWQQTWQDDESWGMDQISAPVGALRLERRQSEVLAKPVLVQATFDEQGLIGKLQWDGLVEPSDALIRGDVLSSHVALESDGTFRVAAGEQLAPGQFVVGATLSDEQQRRQAFLRDFFVTDRRAARDPMFYVWGNLRDPGIDIEGIDRRSGGALHLAPLELVAPAPNTTVRIPQSLLRIRTLQNLTTREGSTAYAWATNEWSEMNAPTSDASRHYVAVRVPECLLPLRLEQVDVKFTIKAPQLKVSLLGISNDQEVVLATADSPQGELSFEVTDSQLLNVNARGEWIMVLQVERLPEASMQSKWQVQGLQIDLRGQANVNAAATASSTQ